VFKTVQKERVKPSKETDEDYEIKTKLAIMGKLMDINGSMREFAQNIETRIHGAYTSRAGG
jgi:hypothetical protein